MFAQGIIGFLIFMLFFWGLWTIIGKKILIALFPPEKKKEEIKTELTYKIEMLNQMKRDLNLKSNEIDITKEIKEVEEDLRITIEELKKLESNNESKK